MFVVGISDLSQRYSTIEEKRKKRANSDWRRTDCLEKEKIVL
jgi:hypothetical protein